MIELEHLLAQDDEIINLHGMIEILEHRLENQQKLLALVQGECLKDDHVTSQILDAIQDMFFMLHPDGRIKMVNVRVGHVLEYAVEEILYDSYLHYFFAIPPLNNIQNLIQSLKQGPLNKLLATCIKSTGERIPVFVSASLNRTKGGGIDSILLMVEDLRKSIDTPSYDAIKVLLDNRMKDFLRRSQTVVEKERSMKSVVPIDYSNQAQTKPLNFLVAMSHEIRTPMHGIIATTDLLAHSDLASEYKQQLLVIEQCATQLRDMIDSMFDFAQIELDMLQLEPVEFNLKDLFDEVCQLFGPKIRNKGIQFTSILEQNIPRKLFGDRVRLRQILVNLLSNALKYTNTGDIYLHIHLLWRDNRQIKLAFIIKDTGIGFSQDVQSKLFNSFFKSVDKTTQELCSAGLSLTICRYLIELMQGTIGVVSEPLKGSIFWFTVVVDESDSSVAFEAKSGDLPAAMLNKDASHVANPKVLLVDDNQVNIQLGKKILSKIGCKVSCVSSGELALLALDEQFFDLVFMDCQMPGMDGFETTQNIRQGKAGEKNKSVPIIALTANDKAAVKARCLKCGMNDFLNKPYTLNDLKQMVVQWCNLSAELS